MIAHKTFMVNYLDVYNIKKIEQGWIQKRKIVGKRMWRSVNPIKFQILHIRLPTSKSDTESHTFRRRN